MKAVLFVISFLYFDSKNVLCKKILSIRNKKGCYRARVVLQALQTCNKFYKNLVKMIFECEFEGKSAESFVVAHKLLTSLWSVGVPVAEK